MRIAFVTNFCPHYRVRTFELLAARLGARFFFFSSGDEWYWAKERGVRRGDFPYVDLPGFSVGGTRVTRGVGSRLRGGEFDAVVKCINGRYALPATYAAARRLGLPFVLWTGIWHRLATPVHRLAHPLTRWIYRHADAVVGYGSHVTAFLRREGVAPERLFVAPHATDNEAYAGAVPAATVEALRRRLGLAADRPVVLFMGRLEESKGVDLLLPALQRMERSRPSLLLVGDGSRRGALEAEVERRGLAGRVRVAPAVAPEDVVPYYALASTLVLPSRTTPSFKEPWGLVVNEAFNQAVPAVVSDAVGAAAGGLVEDGRTGFVVPEGDAAALAAALDRLLADPALRRRLGAAARQRVELWDNEAMVDGFERAVAAAVATHQQGDEG